MLSEAERLAEGPLDTMLSERLGEPLTDGPEEPLSRLAETLGEPLTPELGLTESERLSERLSDALEAPDSETLDQDFAEPQLIPPSDRSDTHC